MGAEALLGRVAGHRLPMRFGQVCGTREGGVDGTHEHETSADYALVWCVDV